jgi:hypothetical protein
VICKPDADIATRGSAARVFVIATRGDLISVRESRLLSLSRHAAEQKERS